MCTTGHPLSLEQFKSAVLRGYVKVIETREVPGIEGVVDESEFLAAACRVREQYCAGDRAGAVQTVADVLTTHWHRDRPGPQTRHAALSEAEALLSWVESLAAGGVRGCSCGEADLGAPGHDPGRAAWPGSS